LKYTILISVREQYAKPQQAYGSYGAGRLPKGFNIGKRNYLAVRKILWKQGMFIDAEDVGGFSPRTLYMSVTDGAVTIRSNGLEKYL